MDAATNSSLALITTIVGHSSFPLYAISIGAVVLAAISLRIGMAVGSRSQPVSNTIVVDEKEVLMDRMKVAEEIGHFGSFLWNFEHPDHSLWTEQVYALLDLDNQRVPPSPEEFLKYAIDADRAKATAAWERVKLSSGPFTFSFRAVSKLNRLMYLKVQGKMVPGKGKGPRLIEGVITDVTKEMEVDRAKSEFVSLASHQLKTPLTSIRWLSESLLKGTAGALAEQQEKYIATVLDSTRRMIEMVNDLLNVSRIETDTLAIRPEDIDVQALATSVIDEQRSVAEDKRLNLQVRYAENLPHLFADQKLVRIIFQNLISNAIKYTPENGTVICDVSLAEASKRALFLTVKDSGIGIPKEEQSRVFEKLHRASNAEKLVPDGTGLGLYLVKTIMDKVGGGITFESIPGEGTTFYVSIPTTWKSTADSPQS